MTAADSSRPIQKRGGYQPNAEGAPPTVPPPKREDARASAVPAAADSSRAPNCRCPKCGYEMWVGPLKVTPGIEMTFLAFCPVDRYEMQRMDALGALEAELAGELKTFEQCVAEAPNVLGVIEAKVPRDV